LICAATAAGQVIFYSKGGAISIARFAFYAATTAAQGQIWTIPTFFRQAGRSRIYFSVPEAQEKVALPDVAPAVPQDVSGRGIKGLARKHVTIRFNAN
jgi:hypothetical protein